MAVTSSRNNGARDVTHSGCRVKTNSCLLLSSAVACFRSVDQLFNLSNGGVSFGTLSWLNE